MWRFDHLIVVYCIRSVLLYISFSCRRSIRVILKSKAMSSELQSTSDSPSAEELSIAIPQSSGRPSRPPSIEGLDFSPLPPAVEDEPAQLFTPIEPSHALFQLGTAEPPTWSLDDDGADTTPLDVEAHDEENEEESEEKPIQEKETSSAIHSATNSTPASIPSTPSYEPTPTLRPQYSNSPPSSLSTHTSTSSFSNQVLASSSSSTNFDPTDPTDPTQNRHRKRLKRKADNRPSLGEQDK